MRLSGGAWGMVEKRLEKGESKLPVKEHLINKGLFSNLVGEKVAEDSRIQGFKGSRVCFIFFYTCGNACNSPHWR
jgi:hypothetical protein